jgi:hypothetical protein
MSDGAVNELDLEQHGGISCALKNNPAGDATGMV